MQHIIIVILFQYLFTGGAYYVPYSFLFILISFVIRGSGLSRVIKFFIHLSGPSRVFKFLFSPAPPHPPPPLNLPCGLLMHKTTYAVCTYDLYSPVHNVLDACISITSTSGRGLGPGN
jgi:hypothetical protein